MEHWLYALDGTDPVGNKDANSWFLFYKKDAGVTHVCIIDGPLLPCEGDELWFCIDGVLRGHATVIKTEYNMHVDGHDVYYDSDKIKGEKETPETILPAPAWRAPHCLRLEEKQK